MNELIKDIWLSDVRISKLFGLIEQAQFPLHTGGLPGSSPAFVLYSLYEHFHKTLIVILSDKEAALHLMNDLEVLLDDSTANINEKKVLFFPATYNNPYDFAHNDNIHALYRSSVIHALKKNESAKVIVCYPESFIEPVLASYQIEHASFQVSLGEELDMEFLIELFYTYGFSNVDFVYEPGQFAVRGGIIDVFGFSYDKPYRIEFSGDSIRSLRSFEPYSQESISQFQTINLLSNVGKPTDNEYSDFFSILSEDVLFWTISADEICENIELEFKKFTEAEYTQDEQDETNFKRFMLPDKVVERLLQFPLVIYSEKLAQEEQNSITFGITPHPGFARNFEYLYTELLRYKNENLTIYIFSENAEQLNRLKMIIEDIQARSESKILDSIMFMNFGFHSGFIDKQSGFAYLTEHQIFERYHRFKFSERHSIAEATVLKDLQNIQPGDYILHIDYGVGQYAGLEKIDVMGKEKEAIRIVYRNNDLLYVGINSLHKISRFTGKEGTIPTLDKIGSGAWQLKKARAKSKIKDIAGELIKLYAERRTAKGHAFLPDSFLQYELEASFIYEDTEDQMKSTLDVKKDMEAEYPMDRLICGDVGFGKTEVAIRAAFKAVCEGKQVAVLVPTTILALQHFQTFTERLKQFPVSIEYLNRFRTTAKIKEIIDKLETGEIDIIIATHKILSKSVHFKDLGLLVVDEEQKFGVSAKEKIRQLRVNIDTLTLTATPIPRTLQFSLLGARDLSVINTPPPNRYPVHTELISFNTRRISEAVMYEVNRGGQVFFVNNKIKNIQEVAAMLRKLCPGVRVETGHGQMDGSELEKIVLDFIEGKFDVFVSTAIVESGIDIPNANTIIINEAQMFGLSDLHQLRGRVGRSNKKAFCYLISPPLVTLSEQSRKRLKAIVELSDLGSGFQISMRDLDIRGAGNLLGAEQSGFISEIGYEMYQKILDEALLELRFEGKDNETDYSDPSVFIADCQIDTDQSLLIPDTYVNNIQERLILYKEINALETEKQFEHIIHRLRDRFGPVPKQTLELIETVRLRLLARRAGIIKISLRDSMMKAYFFKFEQEEFYSSPVYNSMLQYVFEHSDTCVMKQAEDKQLFMTFKHVNTVSEATLLLHKIVIIKK